MKKYHYILVILIIFNCSEDPTYNNPYSSNCDPGYFAPDSLELEQIEITSVKLEWKQKIDKIDGFKIDRRVGDGEWEVEYDISTKTEYVDTAAIPDTSLQYRVYAYADENNSAYAEKDINLNFPAPDSLKLKQLSLNNIQLIWRDNCHGEDGYKIDRKTGDEAWKSEYEILSENIEEWNDYNPKYGVINRYRVYAFTNQINSNIIEASINNIVPAPTEFAGSTLDYQSIELNWEDNCEFESGYKIERKDEFGEYSIISEFGPNVNSYIDDDVIKGNLYTYRLSAYTEDYQSDFIKCNVLNAQPGTKKWEFKTDWGGVDSSPAIGLDGTIYVGSRDEYLYAINPDGTKKWEFKTGNTIYSSPAIGSNGIIYVGCLDSNLYAINTDGSMKWLFNTGGWIRSSPSIDNDGNIYVGCDDSNLYAINKYGGLKWKFETDDQIESSPAIGNEGTIYIGSDDCNLYAINPDGSLQWKLESGDAIRSSPAIGSDGTVYVGSDNLYAINPDGSLKWKFDTGEWVGSSPAIGADGTIYIGSDERKKLYAINQDGTLKWQFNIGSYTYSCSPLIGSDGTIYIGSSTYNLYAIHSDGSKKWLFDIEQGNYSCSCAISTDGIIYVGSDYGSLFALYGECRGLADSPWPMFKHDSRHTGRQE